jgi:hypothetical protein
MAWGGWRGRDQSPTTRARERREEPVWTLGRRWEAWRGGAHRWWRAMLAWSDDGKTSGKTIARPRRLATRKESRNGMVKRRLAAVSGRWRLTSALGKSCEGWWGGDLMPVSPVASRWQVGHGWGFEPWCELETISSCTVHRPDPLKWFIIFQKLNRDCKLWKPSSWCSKISQTFQLDRMKDKE